MRAIRVFAPATVSNVGPGFDVLGFALRQPGDTVDADVAASPGVALAEITGDGGVLPRDAAANAATVAAASVLSRAAETAARLGVRGLRLRLHKGLPLESGLGSSGASAAAGAFAAHVLLGEPLAPPELVACAMEGERAACGHAHADNVAPSLLGGFVLVRSVDPIDLVRLPVPAGLFVAVVHPRCDVSTRYARALLRDREFPLSAVVRNTGNAAALVAALYESNLPLLGRCIEDRIAEPVRAPLIPAFEAVRAAALQAGALGCSISGSGPTMFAFADSEEAAARAALAMRAAFREHAGLAGDTWMGAVGAAGARIVA